MIQGYFIIITVRAVFWIPLLLIFRFFVKIGLPPAHVWFIHLSFFIERTIFLFITSVHKLFPLFVIGKIVWSFTWMLVLIGVLWARRVLIYQACSFSLVLIYSSIVHRSWILLRLGTSKVLSRVYWILYSLLILFFVSSIFSFKLKILSISQGSRRGVIWLILSGLPPFVLFWLKAEIIIRISRISLFYPRGMAITSVIALVSYYWAFNLRTLQHSYKQGIFLIPIILVLAFTQICY